MALDRLYRKKPRTRGFEPRVKRTAKKIDTAESKPVAPNRAPLTQIAPEPIIRGKSAKRNAKSFVRVRPGTGAFHALKRVTGRVFEKTAEWKRLIPPGLAQSGAMQWARRIFRGFVMCAMVLISATMFYLLIIMGDSYDSAATSQGEPAQMENLAQSPLRVDSGKLSDARKYFNAPLLRLSDNSKWKLVEILVLEEQPSGVGMVVREVRAHYRNEDTGGEVDVSSITPSRYLRALTTRGLATVEGEVLVMANMRAVMMSDGTTLHAHAQNGESIYQIEGQISMEDLESATAAASLLR